MWKKLNQFINSSNKQPSNIEAEQVLLGSILVNNDIIDEISTIVNHYFLRPRTYKNLWSNWKLNNKGMIANPITLKNFFEKQICLRWWDRAFMKLTRFSGSVKQAIDYKNNSRNVSKRIFWVDKLTAETLTDSKKKCRKNYRGYWKFLIYWKRNILQSYLQFKKALPQQLKYIGTAKIKE